jgi:ABC-2 type transport system ATP-binding protein
MSAGPAIALDDVSKWYGDVLAVNELTAEIGPGVTGVLGPNGAGKSTLLKVIVGMLAPSLGTARICGVDPFGTPAVMRRVGLVPEQDPAYPRAAVLDVVAYLTRLHGVPAREARERARGALERVGLAQALGRAVTTFSKGMRQRAKLAQAIVHEPDVLILDEPMNGLDPIGRREITDVIRELGSRGCCVLVSSHVLHEVEAMTRRVLLMDHGRLIADGTVAEIRHDLSDTPSVVRVRTSAPRDLARRLLEQDSTSNVEIGLDSVEVTTTRPDALFAELARLAVDAGVPIEAFHPTDESLEAVFGYLTKAR